MSRHIRANRSAASGHSSRISSSLNRASVPGVSGGTASAVTRADTLGQRLASHHNRYVAVLNRSSQQISSMADHMFAQDREVARQINNRT